MAKYTGFPVHNSILSGAALAQQVLSRYHLPTPISCDFFNNGVNHTYIVKAGSTTCFLRIYRYGWRSKAEIQAELEMLTYLHRRRLPVSRPIEKKDGSCLTSINCPEGVRYAVLFTNAPGKGVSWDNEKRCLYGELAGRIHACLDRMPDDHRRFHLDLPHLVDAPLRHIQPFLQHRPQDFDYLHGIAPELKARIDELLPGRSKPEYGNCHGDHHGGNVCEDKKGRMVLFDFDCYGYGWRAYDLAVFRWSGTPWDEGSVKAKSQATKGWNAFLRGYSRVRSLGPKELEATKVFVAIRHIWLGGMHTQGAEGWSRGWINDGYFDFHLKFIKRWIKYHKVL